MVAVFMLISFTLAGFLYVWFLGIAAKWTLKTSVSRKLRWIFYGLVIVLTVMNIVVSVAVGRSASVVVGASAHLLFGAWFFGKFAVQEGVAPGFVGGRKMTAVAMGLLFVACGALFGVSTFILGGRA